MIYKIFEMVSPESVQGINRSGWEPSVLERFVLEEPTGRPYLKIDHDSIESALAEIKDKAQDLTCRTFTVLPIINIDYNGNVQ